MISNEFQIHVDEEKEINESINSVISKMDEVDEIDENHVESNDAFAAYVTIFLINIEIN